MTPAPVPRRARAKPPAAFVLIVVVVCGAAMLAIAMAVVFTGGAGRINAGKEVAADRAAVIAEAGLERATAYAAEVARVEKDYDRLLDDALTTNCGSPPAHARGLPRYDDDLAPVTFPAGSGVSWSVTPFAGGAYLTRFDDDADDAANTSHLTPFTGNHDQNGCIEGPSAGNNIHRDRNRAVWISVIGIYPGTDPAAARHTSSVRRFYIANQSTPPPALAVEGSLTAGHLRFCSVQGDVRVGGAATLTSAGSRCDTLSGGGAVSDATGDATCSDWLTTDCERGGATGDSRFSFGNFPNATDGVWFRWRTPCNFFIDEGDADGVYFWDAGRTDCSGYNGSVIAPNSTHALAGCWVPLMVGGLNPLGFTEVTASGGALVWRPDADNESVSGTVAGTGVANLDGRAFDVVKPNWGACGNFGWAPGTDGARVQCDNGPATARCDGTHTVMSYDTTSGEIAFAYTAATRRALPPGTYFYDGNLTDNAGAPFFPTMSLPTASTSALNGDDWPMMTLVVNGSLTMNGDTRIGVGVGREKDSPESPYPAPPPPPPAPPPPPGPGPGPALPPPFVLAPVRFFNTQLPTFTSQSLPRLVFPSLAVQNNLVVNGDVALAGAVWVRGNANFNGGSHVQIHGVTAVLGSMAVGSGGALDLVVRQKFIADATSIAVAAPSSGRTLR